MMRIKILLSIGLVSVFLVTQIIAVGAAPANQDYCLRLQVRLITSLSKPMRQPGQQRLS